MIPSPSLLRTGQLGFSAALVFFGVQQLHYRGFVTRLLPWPETMPAREVTAMAAGAMLILAGVAICVGWRRALISSVLGAVIFASALCFAIPAALADATFGGAWTNAGKACALAGGAWIVAASGAAAPTRIAGVAAWLGRFMLAWFLAQSGLQHFRWAEFVQHLVPAWMPGAMFWTYLTGAALVAAGIGLLIPRFVRLTAALTAGMVGTWVFLVHLPRTLGQPGDRNEATALFEAIAISAILLVIWARERIRSASASAA